MKHIFFRNIQSAVLAALLPVFLVGCGHTMYGVGQDMQNLGQRMKGQHHPQGTTPYQAPNTTPYYGSGANQGGTYYPPQSAPNQYGYPQ